MKAMTLLAAMAGMGMFTPGLDEDSSGIGHKTRYPKTPKERNKFGLTEEERELMSHMTPKEKKRFLKSRVK